MMSITITHVSKLFRRQKQRTLKEMLPALTKGKKNVIDSFWALKDVSLKIAQGETFGIIGPNGSGKSTLLKLIAGVSQPSQGTISVSGQIAPLIELGAGFHPELTGKENVYLNGVILGMKRTDIEAKFKSIVDFAELWEFIDQPVKHYSSGMYLRLAFAVAIHTNPDILLIDEILAVGDAAFQEKCLAKMHQFHDQGKTIIMVTHSLDSVASFCTSAAYLKNGHVQHLGAPEEVIQAYRNSTVGQSQV